MNWAEAVEQMRRGHTVHRASEQQRALISEPGESAIYECGTEGVRLAAAWSVDDAPVFVFQGAGSKVMFVPEDHHKEALDWEVAPHEF